MRKRTERAAAVTVSPREFIRAWQESTSVAEVAQKVRAKKNAVRVRAWRYRELGIPLKEFPPVEFEPIDWDDLARYAAELIGEERDKGNDDQGDGQDEGDEDEDTENEISENNEEGKGA